MIQQQTARITSLLLETSLVRVPWVSEIWQKEARTLFNGFDQDGESAIETNVTDSDIPANELQQLMQACTVYGYMAVRDAIEFGLILRNDESTERDDIGAYKATLNF